MARESAVRSKASGGGLGFFKRSSSKESKQSSPKGGKAKDKSNKSDMKKKSKMVKMEKEEECKMKKEKPQRRLSAELTVPTASATTASMPPMAPKIQPRMESQEQSRMSSRSAEQPKKAPPPSGMRNILLKQKATGSWSLDEVVPFLLPLTADKIKSAMPKKAGDNAELEAIWVTAVVVAYLKAKFPSEQTSWQQVVNKGQRWIAKQKKTVKAEADVDWLQEAESFVQSNA